MGSRVFTTAAVLAVAVLTALILLSDPEHIEPPHRSSISASDGGYYKRHIQAPHGTGFFLSTVAAVLTKLPGSGLLRRVILNKNKLHTLRELAAQFPGLPPLYYPMLRFSSAQYREATALAQSPSGDVTKVLRAHADSPASSSQWDMPTSSGDQLLSNSIHTINRAYSEGLATPETLAERLIAAEKRLRSLHPFSSFLPADIREQAAASTARWAKGEALSILDGVPVAVKEMICVRGHPLYRGMRPTPERKANVCGEDDVLVGRLRALGALIVGTTVMTEGGVTPLGYAPFFQGPLNPHNRTHYCGGSSGGSAVAVASGLVPAAIGFDGGGSIRIPAALSGVFGLAASFGRVPHSETRVVTMLKSGVLAASAQDAAIVYAAISPPDAKNFYTDLYGGDGPPPPELSWFGRFEATADLTGVRLGIFPEHFEDAEPHIVRACYGVVEYLKSRGAQVVNVTVPHLHHLALAHGIKISSEFALGFDLPYTRELNDGGVSLEANTRITVGIGATASALEVIAADRLRHFAFRWVNRLFDEHGLTAIVSPTTYRAAPKIPAGALETGEYNAAAVVALMRHIFLANLIGAPAVSVPIGREEATSLPFAVQFMGGHWSEGNLLELGRIVQDHYLPGQGLTSTLRPRAEQDWADLLANI